jgi:glycosidase
VRFLIGQSDIIYFILTDRFSDGDSSNNFDVVKTNSVAYHGGDFVGIIEKIPYLKNLGVTAVWVTPVYLNIHRDQNESAPYHGYWSLDFEKVDHHLYSSKSNLPEGSKEYVKQLAEALHKNGLKLILDMVVNHTGYDHPGLRGDPSTPIKPYWFNSPNETSDEKKWLDGLPDLNHDLPEVADYFFNNVVDWIEATGIDGIRMDTVKNVERTFWYHFKSYVRGKYPQITVIGEVLEQDIPTLSRFQRYFAFDSLFDFALQQAIWDVFIHNSSLNRIARARLNENEPKGVLDKDFLYTNQNRLVVLLDNHDLPKRFFSEALDACNGDKQEALKIFKMATTFQFTTRGIPQIYYGTEIAMEGYGDPDNRRDMRWDIFEGKMEPSSQYPIEKEAFNHLKKLANLRNQTQALQFAPLLTLYADYFVYSYLREFRGESVIVVMNNGQERMPSPLTISISSNRNIPPRITKNLEGKVLHNQIEENDLPIQISKDGFMVQLNGKTAAVYK